MNPRTVVFWLHLSAGCIGGAIILLMSVTGVLLTYERQMIAWGEWSGYRTPPPSVDAERMSLDLLLAQVAASAAEKPSSVIVRSRRDDPVAVRLGRGTTLYVNGYSGETLGEGSGQWQSFFSSLRAWHRWVALSGDNRAVGKAITGACNLAFLFITISGIYIWWPRTWTRARLAAVTLFRGGLAGKARDFNWHNVIGFWSVGFLFLISLSGSVISYGWMSDAVYRVMGEEPPERTRQVPKEPLQNGFQEYEPVNVDLVFAAVERQFSDWTSISIPLPEMPENSLRISLDRGSGGQPHLRSTVIVDGATGEVVRREDYGDGSPGRQMRLFLRFAHTGEAGGIAGQTLAGIATLGACFLAYTGIALSLRRFAAWRRRRA